MLFFYRHISTFVFFQVLDLYVPCCCHVYLSLLLYVVCGSEDIIQYKNKIYNDQPITFTRSPNRGNLFSWKSGAATQQAFIGPYIM